jgi:hypothetical protein
MLKDRNLRKSVMARGRSLLSSPPAGSGLSAYTVYSEKQMREVTQGTLTPITPFVFLVDSFVRPTDTTLPMIVVEVPRASRRPFEVGNRNGRRTEAIFHVFGRQRGERDDLASFLADNLGGVMPVYDYTGGSQSALVENGLIEDEVVVEEVTLRRDDLRWESSLDLWSMVSFAFQTVN